MSTPLVLVHGVRLSGAAWAGQLARLSPARRVLAVDLPGHGSRRGTRFTLSAAVDVVAGAVAELGGQAVVVGHSLGGYVAVATAARHPAAVTGLVLAGSTLVPARVPTFPFTLAHRLLSALPDGGERLSGRVFDAVLPRPTAEAVRRGGIATEVIPDVVGAVRAFDVLSALASYPGPVRLVNGGHDHFRAHERRFLARCADGRLVVIPRAGHYLPMTHPDTFTRQLTDRA